jgi:hypothetical protein
MNKMYERSMENITVFRNNPAKNMTDGENMDEMTVNK